MAQFNETMTNYYSINELRGLIRANQKAMDVYIRELDDRALDEFYRTEAATEIQIKRLYNRFSSQEAYFALNAISNSVESYKVLWHKSIQERSKGIENYYEAYYEGSGIYDYTEVYVQELLYTSLREGSILYNALAKEADLMHKVSLLLILVVVALSLGFAFFFADYIVRPIKKLADVSREMADGKLDVEDVSIGTGDEVGVLAESFNTMSGSIRDYVEDLHQKVIIEKKLHEEEIANIRMAHLLQSAEFQALQSQVNPHFLFNTLNTISRTAMFEEADDTVKLIYALSNLLRYRIKSSEDMVSLEEELSLINEYIYLQKMRFKDRLDFTIKTQGDLSQVKIPVFTLQPLVENAIIHGIEPKIEGGKVRIRVNIRPKKTVITVTDTGSGMAKDQLDHLLDKCRMKKADRIGVANVFNRVKLHYGERGHFKMYSRKGMGTIVKLIIDRD